MLVLAVGTASANFVAGEGDTRADRTQEASGGSVGGGEVELSGDSGGSVGPLGIIQAVLDEIARQPDAALSFR